MGNDKNGGSMKRFNDGDVIFREKEVHPYMYKVLKGKVALYVSFGEEQENILGILGEGKFFGEVSMLTGRPQVYTVAAIEDALLLKVGEEQLEQFLSDNRSNMAGMLRSMAQVIVTQNMNISLLMEDLQEIIKQIPKEVKLDPIIEMKLEQYKARYSARGAVGDSFIFSTKV